MSNENQNNTWRTGLKLTIDIVILTVAIFTLVLNCKMQIINDKMLRIASKMPNMKLEVDYTRSKLEQDTLFLSFILNNLGTKMAKDIKVNFLIDSSYIYYLSNNVYPVQKPKSNGWNIVIPTENIEPYSVPYTTGIVFGLSTDVLSQGSGSFKKIGKDTFELKYVIRTADTIFEDSIILDKFISYPALEIR